MRELRRDDVKAINHILRATGAFTETEVAVALELIEIILSDPEQKDYAAYVAETDGRVSGYILYGQVPLTEGNYEIYWIAVDPATQGQGVGRKLLRHLEELLRAAGGRMICLETSSQPGYARTRLFYDKADYVEESCIRDFYRPDDHRLTYVKRLI